MIDIFTRGDLDFLLDEKNANSLSLYMPTAKAEPNVRKNMIRFKNLLVRAEKLISARGLSSDLSNQILDPLRKMAADNIYWANQDAGLGIFRNPDMIKAFRLPMKCNDFAMFTDHFHVTPLLSFLQKQREFYVLALSQNNARLLKCSTLEEMEIEVPEMPRSLAEALKYDEPEKQLQFHTGSQGGGGKRPAMFHGHGVGIDEKKDNLLRYFQAVNKAVTSLLQKKKTPLILASVDYLYSIYRQANTYPNLLEAFIEGNPDEYRTGELHAAAWPIIERQVEEDKKKPLSRFKERAGTGYTSVRIRDIVPAACFGRVDTLFLSEEHEQWGVLDEPGHDVALHQSQDPDNYSLPNFAAVNTLKQGGTVHTYPHKDMPGELMAAIFRY
jgi:hypothetical protein